MEQPKNTVIKVPRWGKSETFEPLNDRILVREFTEVETEGGIFLPDARNSDSREARVGIVIKAGPGRGTPPIPIGVDKGDIVYFNQHLTQLNLDGEPYVVVEGFHLLGYERAPVEITEEDA